ncbi:MAG: 5'/3'-nucleotidase SurE [Anaerolineales bacterium]
MTKPQILLTNDDGILSPGLWAAAAALAKLGFVTIAAPREQSSGMGRSLPASSDGIIHQETLQVGEQSWQAYAIGGSPAQAVLHALLEILPQKPDLVVSGINYGENVAAGITVSGTVGAAMEAAASGIPALAVSLETDKAHHLSYSTEIDFSSAAHFTARFAQAILERGLPAGMNLLKIDVPAEATPQTPWAWTRLSNQRYYRPTRPQRASWLEPGTLGYELAPNLAGEPDDSDVFTLLQKRLVSVTPLTLDFTARVEPSELKRVFGQ